MSKRYYVVVTPVSACDTTGNGAARFCVYVVGTLLTVCRSRAPSPLYVALQLKSLAVTVMSRFAWV